MRQSTFARAAAAALVLICSAPMVSAQGSSLPPSVSLPFGNMLGTSELAVMIRNLSNEMKREIERLRAEQAEGDKRLQSQVNELQDRNRLLLAELDRQKQELLGLMNTQEAQFKRVIDRLATELSQVRRDADQLRGDQSVLASDITGGKDNLSKLQIEREQLSGRLNGLQSQLGDLREKTTRLETASAGLGNKNAELGTSVATVTTAQAGLRAEMSSELSKSAAELEALRKAVAELRATVAVLEAGLQGAQRSVNDVKEVSSKVEELKRRIEPVETTIDGRVFDALPAEVAAYKAAVGKVERGEFAAARVDLQQFLASVSNPGFRGSALYWLGQAQYASSQFREAQASFGDMVKFSPDHPRAAEAMLAMANCQLELKEPRANVRRSLDNLIKLHPKTKAAAEAKELLARLPR